MTGQAIIVVIALLMLFRDRRNNWPYILAAASLFVGDGLKASLTSMNLVDRAGAL